MGSVSTSCSRIAGFAGLAAAAVLACQSPEFRLPNGGRGAAGEGGADPLAGGAAGGAAGAGAPCAETTGDCDGNAGNGCETDLETSARHCGACGRPCELDNAEAACRAGRCRIARCEAPFADCDGDPENGCEADTSSNVEHCGACDDACVAVHGKPVCAASRCATQCDAGFGDCDADPDNGCERDLERDVNHCGQCGRVCDPTFGTPWCDAGQCGVSDCPAGFGDCNADSSDGCEADLTADTDNCGVCGNLCLAANGSARCTQGICVVESCDAGFADCNAETPEGYSDGCEKNLQSNAEHCGGCGQVCEAPHGTNRCSAGACVPDCEGRFLDCDADVATGCEVEPSEDPRHCGGCGVVCEAPHGTNRCSAGACVPDCEGQFLDCDADATTGCEVDPESDSEHCGACGNACRSNNTQSNLCVNGSCRPTCLAGFANCDGNGQNGCEAETPCGGAVLLSEDFESGTDGWQTNAGGSWSLVSDGSSVYAQSNTDNALRMASAGATGWTDVVVEVRVKVLAFSGTSTSFLAGLCLRRQDEDNLYLLGVRSDGRVGVRRRVGGSFNNIGASSDDVVTTGVWYTLRAEFVGTQLSVFLDDVLLMELSDASHTWGGIGLCSVSTSARFDDVLVLEAN